MDLWKIVLVTMFASGFVAVASFHVGNDLNRQDGGYGLAPKECRFCYYYFQTGRGPYEVLWKLGFETRSHMSLRSQILMMMDPGHLKIAEYVFHDYCDKICGPKDRVFRRPNSVAYTCDNENGNIDYE